MSTPYPDDERGTFITQTFPCVFDNTIIVAATHPTVSTGSQFDDGWFLSDFYAFNYLLKGSPSKLLKKHGPYYHGTASECPKVVLSPELLESEITPVTVVPPAQMIDRFLDEVSKAAARAKGEHPILLMVFCHATLIVTVCYSGGWVVAPDVNSAALAAATSNDVALSFPVSASLGRVCGSLFARAIIDTLSRASSPLLTQEARKELDDSEGSESIQPEEPTKIQTETYNEFCRSVTTVHKARGVPDTLTEGFCFSAQDDQWTFSVPGC
ncbi:hypothetical protein B0T26DRAFT_744763 [Lasiosphaeria miniovina]|uniref:Uncharacterized protein n=1 Tax=Lasiosphaeria miniovina TaxID=1954250 RepID=A0AA40DHP0_9PEZI|nr:uncharacterized protein B0T26DRAFT_744763 [Lasiosphaeria miniovina]KAK0701736.1 hypothetical protein B0T26DRAFT_744763 [Lasiosphaeria miniovina]